MRTADNETHREPWNKGKIIGQKAPFKLKDIWALRVRLQIENRVRELALFNLGIDSKLRGCDLIALKVRDVCHGDQMATRAVVMQHKTQRPVQFEIMQATRDALQAWIRQEALKRRRRYRGRHCARLECIKKTKISSVALMKSVASKDVSSGLSHLSD